MRVRVGAFGAGRPHRDPFLSADHAVGLPAESYLDTGNRAAVALDDARLGHGFHEVEIHGAHRVRWTNGEARIRLGRGDAARRVEVDVAAVFFAPRRPFDGIDIAGADCRAGWMQSAVRSPP